MRAVVGTLRLLRASLHVLHGMWVMRRFPRLDAAGRHAAIRWWSAGLLKAMGLELRVVGVAPRSGAALIVANHVSWLDIATIHAVAPHARFVSKADVLAWPLLGWLIRGAGTLFIEREKKRDAIRVLHAMGEALQAGDTVAVFPEGTTGPGEALLPFHANLLQAAVATATPVQPVALRFFEPGQRFSSAAQFLGETTLLQSVWRMACARGLGVEVAILPPVESGHADRRALAERLRGMISAQLGVDGAAAPAAPRDAVAAD